MPTDAQISTFGPTWAKVAELYPSLTKEIVYKIDGRQVVSSGALRTTWDLSTRQFRVYQERGLPNHPASTKDLVLHDLEDADRWRNMNFKLGAGKASVKVKARAEEEGNDSSDILRKSRADADRAIQEALISELKRKQLEGILINAEELDVALAELAVIYVTGLSNDKKVLPMQLKGKDDGYIRKYLDEHYSNRVADLDKLITKVFPDSSDSLYEIVTAVLNKLDEGRTPTQIVEALE